MIDPSQLTVVIPTFNRLDLLKVSLRSLENQTIKGFNVLILDDCSTDGTSKYLTTLSSETFQFETINREQNMGCFQNLLDGIERVKTRYISFLSDDNVYLPYCLERLLFSINEEKEVKLVIGSHNLISYNGKILRYRSKRNNSKYGRKNKLVSNLSNNHARQLQLQKKIVSIDSAIFFTNQLKAAAALEKHGLDYTLFSQYLVLGGNAKYISESLMNYRENPHGISQNPKSQISFAIYVIDSCDNFLANNNLSSYEITWVKNEIFRYKYVLIKHGLLKPQELRRNFQWNRNLQCYKIMLKLPIVSLMRNIKQCTK